MLPTVSTQCRVKSCVPTGNHCTVLRSWLHTTLHRLAYTGAVCLRAIHHSTRRCDGRRRRLCFLQDLCSWCRHSNEHTPIEATTHGICCWWLCRSQIRHAVAILLLQFAGYAVSYACTESVWLSACISQKPHGRTSSCNLVLFCVQLFILGVLFNCVLTILNKRLCYVMFIGLAALRHVMYVRFCGWRRVSIWRAI